MATKNKEQIEKEIFQALEEAKKNKMTEKDIEMCINQVINDIRAEIRYNKVVSFIKIILNFHFIKSLIWFMLYRLLPLGILLVIAVQKMSLLYNSDPCFISQPVLHDFANPIVNCTRCRHIKGPLVIHNIQPREFMEKHAFDLQPLLMKGAALNWSAIRVFSYDYFKSLYTDKPDALDYDANEGQFFSYSSGIFTLDEFLELDNETAALKGKKWYIGWSTSEPYIGKQLRKHVSSPYFLPPKSSDDHLAWIFMGAPGPGAGLHVDWVGRPSWQAQLSGKKTWTLVPPVECEEVCSSFNITMERGDIIVVDTNAWFHATYIHPGAISITYGTEFE